MSILFACEAFLSLIHSDDLDYLPVLASLPPQLTVFEYLVGCWKRINTSRTALLKKVCSEYLFALVLASSRTTKGYPPLEMQHAITVLDKIRDLVVSYTGLTLQEPEMFPQPSGLVLILLNHLSPELIQ